MTNLFQTSNADFGLFDGSDFKSGDLTGFEVSETALLKTGFLLRHYVKGQKSSLFSKIARKLHGPRPRSKRELRYSADNDIWRKKPTD